MRSEGSEGLKTHGGGGRTTERLLLLLTLQWICILLRFVFVSKLVIGKLNEHKINLKRRNFQSEYLEADITGFEGKLQNVVQMRRNREKQCSRSTVEDDKNFLHSKDKDWLNDKALKKHWTKSCFFFSWEVFSWQKSHQSKNENCFSIAIINS